MTLDEYAILAARKWFADNCYACISQAIDGSLKVNDLQKYIKTESQKAKDFLAGKHDKTFTFMQRAWYIQTGESVAFLPKQTI